MKKILRLAWRNLWRNKKRTLITIGSVMMAVIISLMYAGLKDEAMDMMAQAVIHRTGTASIHKKGYWDKQTLNNAFVYTSDLKKKLDSISSIECVIPRIQNFVLSSTKQDAKGTLVLGVDPEVEDRQSALRSKVTFGRYFNTPNDRGVLLAKDLARYFKIDTDKEKSTLDTLVLYGGGYQGITVAEKLPIIGIVDLPTPIENKTVVYMTLNNAQGLFSPYVPNLLTDLSIVNNENKRSSDNVLKRALEQQLDLEKYEVMLWSEKNPEIVESMKLEDISRFIIMTVIYLIVGMGLLSTLVMSTLERSKEMAVMNAIGVKIRELKCMVFIESVLMGGVGTILGSLTVFPILYYLHHNPIPLEGEMAEGMARYNLPPVLPVACNGAMFLMQIGVVFLITCAASLYPILTLSRLNITHEFSK